MPSQFQLAAAKRWPRSAAHGRIRGNGPYVIELPRYVYLFQSDDERQAKLDTLSGEEFGAAKLSTLPGAPGSPVAAN
jgi:hypothetical protein